MTPRDWQKDMERIEWMKHARTLCNQPIWQEQTPQLPEPLDIALEYWLKEAKVYKLSYEGVLKYAGMVEDREKQLQALLNDTLGCLVMYNGSDNEHVSRITAAYRTLYPDTPAPKEGSHDETDS
ncbi:hypothetical protein [Paenibacillus sp. FSL M7-0896]|uniref:hypothetical protein n=1 Tax=Paenibacillus sp. FSL M7-0896 TaxID=2921610 RepID=UPI0030D70EF1